MNYVPRGGTGLTAAINIMNNKWQLGILTHISTNGCYVYISKGNMIEGYHNLLHAYEYTDFWNN